MNGTERASRRVIAKYGLDGPEFADAIVAVGHRFVLDPSLGEVHFRCAHTAGSFVVPASTWLMKGRRKRSLVAVVQRAVAHHHRVLRKAGIDVSGDVVEFDKVVAL